MNTKIDVENIVLGPNCGLLKISNALINENIKKS